MQSTYALYKTPVLYYFSAVVCVCVSVCWSYDCSGEQVIAQKPPDCSLLDSTNARYIRPTAASHGELKSITQRT